MRFRVGNNAHNVGQGNTNLAAGPCNAQPNVVQNQVNKAQPMRNNAGTSNANNQNRPPHGQQNVARPAANASRINAYKANMARAPVKQEAAPVEEVEMEQADGDDAQWLPENDDNGSYDYEELDDVDLNAIEDGVVDDSGFVDAVQVEAAKPGISNGNRRGSIGKAGQGAFPQNGRAPSAPLEAGKAGRNSGQVGNRDGQVRAVCRLA